MTLSIDHLVNLRSLVALEPPQWAADGQSVIALSSLGGASNLWSFPRDGGFPTRLTAGLGGVRFLDSPNMRLSPDGRLVAYVAATSGQAEIWLWSAQGGASRQLTHHAGHINALSWSPDSQTIVYSGNRYGAYDIYTVDVASGDSQRLTSSPLYEVYPVFTPDGHHIVYVRLDERWLDHEVVVIPAMGGAERVVLRDENFFDYHYGRTFGYPQISPDSQTLLFRSHRNNWINYWTVPLAGGAPTPLCAAEADQSEAQYAPDGRHIALISNHNGTLTLDVVNADGSGRRTLVKPEQGACAVPQWSPDARTIAYLYQSPTDLLDLWTVDVANGARRRLSNSMVGGGVEDRLIRPEKIIYRSFDGLPISAYLYKPHIQPGQRYPGLMLVHGGPTSQWFDAFHPMAQYFAAQGYAVMLPNVRGSSGYGLRFQDMNKQDYGGGDLKDVIAGVDYLKTLDWIDPNKMAITGTSYGGYLTLAAVCFAPPGTFQAGIAASGYADRVSMYYEQELRHVQQVIYKLGPIEDNLDVYKRISPLYSIEQANFPVFILHGVGRLPQADDSRRFAEALEKEYKVVQYKTYPGETYYVQSAANTRQMWLDMQAFLKKYLDGAL